jgi:hypothetical protein
MISVRSRFRIGIAIAGLALPALLFVLPGCMTARDDNARYVKDGVHYGITDGPFRGRWWSYYERGRSFQEGGFFEEAARDFHIAIQSRRTDGYWPRTYGMHFAPEYFPHRELGANLYHQGDIEGSIAELEISLAQQYSARAAYYYMLAQQKKLAAGAPDSEAPTVEILTNLAQASATELVLTGIARDDTFVSSVEVAGVPFDVRLIQPDVEFSMPVQLAPGDNTIPLTVTDLAGNEYVTDVALNNDVDGPAVSFDGPVSLPGVVTGVVLDPSGVASLTIGGIEARLEDQGGGLTRFEASIPATPTSHGFTCTDTLGNTTAGLLPGLEAAESVPVALASSAADSALGGLLEAGRMPMAATGTTPVSIKFENIPQGAAYYQDEIVVALNARSEAPIFEVTLRGRSIPVVPARNDVYITRREPLGPGPNILDATIADMQGNRAADARTVSREKSEIEITRNLLSVTMMPDPLADDPQLTGDVIDEVEGLWERNLLTLFDTENGGADTSLRNRFDLKKRETIAALIAEQNLSAELNSQKKASDGALLLGRLESFEVLLSVNASIANDVLSIDIDAISAETGFVLAEHVGVAGARAEMGELVRLLALRLIQEFPKPQGEIVYSGYPEFDAAITELQGTRRHRKCLVFKLEDQVRDGVKLGVRPTVLAEGVILGTGAQTSSAEIVKPLRESIDLSGLDLATEGFYAVLK